MDKLTRSVIKKYPIFVVTFKPGTDMLKVFRLRKLCHCIIRWEKFQNSRPIRQCFNCQSFGHSSNFCGRSPKCVKCDQQHASKDCTKPVGSLPKWVNCGGEHPANYTGCPQYLRQLHLTPQINNQQQRKPHNIKTSSPQFQYQQHSFLHSRPPTVNIPTAVMGTSCNSDISKLLSSTHKLSIRTFKNYHEHVQPQTSVHTDASTGSQTSRNKRSYHQTGDRDWHSCWLFLSQQIIHNLRIVAWNANSVSTKKAELDLFLRVNKIDIAAISETKISPNRNFPYQDVQQSDRTETNSAE